MPDEYQLSESRDQERAAAPAEVRTILIADIRGFTTFTREHGDEAAAELAERFAHIVADAVAARDGRLVELRGDEALAVFGSSRQALRAAVELQSRVADAALARGIGIGLDAGEAVPVADGYRGSALNLAARLCAHAGPGEILASDGVVHLAATVDGIRYMQPRRLRLKGFDTPVRAVRVVGVAKGQLRRPARGAAVVPRLRRAPVVVGLIGAGVAVALLVALRSNAFQLGGGGGPEAPFDGPGVTFLDVHSGAPVAERIPLRNPVEVEYVDGSFWVFDLQPTALHRIDPSTDTVVTSIPISFSPGSWIVDGGTIWFTDYEEPIVHKLDVTSGREVDQFTIGEGSGLQGIAKGAGSLWVAIRDHPHGLARLDPATGDVLRRYPVWGSHVVATDSEVWVAGFNAGELARIDPATDAVTDRVPVVRPTANLLLAGVYVWASNPEEGEVYKVGSSGTLLGAYEVPGAWYLGAGEGHIWAAGAEDRTLGRIDILTGAQMEFAVGRAVNDLAEGAGELAVVMPRQMEDAVTGLTGEVLEVASPFGLFEYTDPAIRRNFETWGRLQVEQASCAKLLNYPDTEPPPDGAQLQPEVAAAMPEVSDDGLTYTFRVRAGYAFSPPSNEPLTAETFRFSIERALSPRLGPNAVGINHLRDVEGAVAFHDGEADSVSGLEAEGDTLTIRLTEPSADILERLALPYFCPVPLGTPAIVNGINFPPLPRSGPYYLADHIGGVVLVLKRNPNYPGPRQATFDAIVWREFVQDEAAVQEVERGDTDMVLLAEGLRPGGEIDSQWGPDSTAAATGLQRYFEPPEGAPHFFSERVGCQVPMANAPGINLVALCLRDP